MDNKVNSNILGIHYLTPLQEGMLFHKLMDQGSTSYFNQAMFEVQGEIEENLFIESWNLVALKHEILRTVFVQENVEKPRQVVLKERNLEINRIDLSDDTNAYERIQRFREEDVQRGFHLTQDTLLRINLFKMGNKTYHMLWSFHHVIMDGWSVSILLKDFQAFYDELMAGRNREEVVANIVTYQETHDNYGKFVEWIEECDHKKGLHYWKELLQEYDEIADVIPTTKGDYLTNQVDEQGIELSLSLSKTIMDLAKNVGVTTNIVIETALGILLQKCNRSRDVVFGKVVSGRNIKEFNFNETVGLFINTIPVRITSELEMTVEELLIEVQRKAVLSDNYEHCSLAEIQSQTSLGLDLIKVLYTFENYYVTEEDETTGKENLKIELQDAREETNYDISVMAYSEHTVSIKFIYNAAKFCKTEITRLLEKMEHIISDMAVNPQKKIEDLQEVSEEERLLILEDFNRTQVEYSDHKTITEVFEEVAETYPDEMSVIFCEESLTYRELNEKANRLAWKLIEFGIKKEDYVAISANRCMEFIVGILGVIKAGAAYVPIDVSHPPDRIQYMLEDCGPKLLLCGKTSLPCKTMLPVWNLFDEESYSQEVKNPDKLSGINNLAYLIYTSGTTGKPKGVMVEHHGVLALANYGKNALKIEPSDVILQFSNSIFDASVWDIMMALLNGATLCMIPEEIITNIPKFREYIKMKNVSIAVLPPQYYLQAKPEGLKIIGTAGSAANAEIVESAIKRGCRYTNAYGPTESTVQATAWECKKGMEVPSRIPIGKPISNTNVYVLNKNKLCGIGIPGELCISGAGIARGYLNRDELTREKFIKNPFGSGTLYRSGDLARWLPDGNLEYMGRIDEQVKIRGFRIELNEVEYVLRKQEGVSDATVIAREDENGDKIICAYYVGNGILDIDKIRKGMEKEVPEYMIPAYFMQIEKVPVNRSGKVDRKALPEIEMIRNKLFLAARNETEEKLVTIFSGVLDLNVEQISINDSFFEIGGHSLRATRMMNQIESVLGVKVSLKDIFSKPTVEELSELMFGKSEAEYKPIPVAEKREYYSMSSAQKRIFLVEQMDDTGIAYNTPVSVELQGKLDKAGMQTAFQALVDRHDILRTIFLLHEGEPVQYINETLTVQVIFKKSKEEISKLYQEFVRPFCLEEAPLIRMMVLETGDEKNTLFLDMHHIITDGMSINILIDEFTKLYNGASLEKPGVQYKDYSEWMKTYPFEKQREYWTKQFSDEIPILDLPYDYKRPKIQSFRGKIVTGKLKKEDRVKLAELVRRTKTTDYMVLLSILMILLSKYGRQEDIVVGTPLSGRTHKDTENMIGMFVNTLVMRGKPEKSKTYIEFLQDIKKTCLEAYENQEFPFDELIEMVEISRDLSRNPLFDIFFTLQGSENEEFMLNDTMTQDGIEHEYAVAKFDLTLNAVEDNGEYCFMFEYCTDLFVAENIQVMMDHYIELLTSVLENADVNIGDINTISEQERKLILEEFNCNKIIPTSNKTIYEEFEEQVKKYPDKAAIIYEEQQITYKQLDEKINGLANYLRSLGVRISDRIAIFTSRSIEMVIGMYGVMKAGGIYIPIDPTYPEKRIAHILEDCDPKVILLEHDAIYVKARNNIPIISLTSEESYIKEEQNVRDVVQDTDLAYIIYTSGTTGKPKGVMVNHQGVINLKSHVRDAYQVTSDDVVLKFANAVFDASVWEINMALLTGATLFIASLNMVENERELNYQLADKNVTIAAFPPNYLAQLEVETISGLRILVTAGSASEKEIIVKYGQNVIYVNEYGPTEVTVSATYWKNNPLIKLPDRIPIGKPIINKQIYIMDGMQLCGIGVPGELCIAGVGIAKGYWNRPELTAEKFIKNPYGTGQLYRSGDLARWLPDGNLDFLGRVDEQVKIRGYRIELLEVETILKRQPGIRDAAVIVENDGGESFICGYVVSGSKLDVEAVRAGMKQEIPDYMVPSYIMEIEYIPITKNGKTDRRALPKIEIKSMREYIAPRTTNEIKIAAIFEEILGVEKIGIQDDFFELGGHSLRAAKVANSIEAEFGVKISIRDIFKYSTVEGLSRLLRGEVTKTYLPIPQAEKKKIYPMSSAQRRIYMVCELEDTKIAYNMPESMEWKGEMDFHRLQSAFEKLITRHEALRTSFHMEDGAFVQRITEMTKSQVNFVKAEKEIPDIYQEFIQPFNLEKAPLMRVMAVEESEMTHMLFIDVHHIIADGVSVNILLRELAQLYNGEELKPLKLQYKDYSEWMIRKDLKGQKEYWTSLYQGEIPILDMPYDFSRPKIQSYRGNSVNILTDLELRIHVEELVKKTNTTEYMVLLSALMIMLGKYTRQEDIIIGSPVSGRTHKDTEDMVGMFVNTLAMRGKPGKKKSYSTFLGEVKENCLESYENQEYPFEELIESIQIERDMSRNPLFDVMFILQNNKMEHFTFHNSEIGDGVEDVSSIAKFDMTISIAATETGYQILFEYCSDIYKEDSIKQMMEHYLVILKEITKDSEKSIGEIEGIGEGEKHKILQEFNDTEVPYPKDKTIAELFEDQVKKAGNRLAVVYQEEEMSYHQLNEKANRLALRLQEQGVQPEDYVAMMVERSAEMAIAILGILKAGGAFVPIDPTYPKERIHFMLEDCKPKIAVTGKTQVDLVQEIKELNIYDEDSYCGDGENLVTHRNPNHLAYLIYTSGTTGKPKGVMIEHYGVANLREYFLREQGVREQDRVLQFANIVFDAAVSELTMSLLLGGCMYMIPEEIQKDISAFERFVKENEISIGILPPQYLAQVKLEGMRAVITAGSETSRQLVEQNGFTMSYSNDYGPTEATVCATHWSLKEGNEIPDRIPIGKPIGNKKIYILNGDTLCGIGIPGELCIAGDGLARGYLNQKVLTAKKFVRNPYGEGNMYRSGDLARWLPDGNLEFLGRIDEQVKIRGYRIELLEVESVLREQPGVEDAAVIVRDDQSGEKGIYAYYTGEDTEKDRIRNGMGNQLPDYMIPSYFMKLTQIPMNQSGKVDKKALPEMEIDVHKEYLAPRNQIEITLAALFQEVLGFEKIGIEDSFFEMGGDSIKAIRIVSKSRERGLSLTVKDIMSEKCIRMISKCVREEVGREYPQEAYHGEVEMVPIQREFLYEWKFKRLEHFNQAMAIKAEKFNHEVMHETLKAIICHHDMLRAVYRKGILWVRGTEEIPLYEYKVIEASNMEGEEQLTYIHKECTRVQESFNLETGPLIKVVSILDGKEEHLLICIHHLAMDGVSWRILLDDFKEGYQQYLKEGMISLPKKTASFHAWSCALKEYGETSQVLQEKQYWEKVVLGIEGANLKAVAREKETFEIETFTIDETITNKILYESSSKYNTEINDLLLTVLAMSIHKCTGQDKVAVHLEGHGREEIHRDINISRTIGWFTISYPVILSAGEGIENTIISTKEILRKIPNKGIGYGVLKPILLENEHNSIDIGFNYLGQIDETKQEDQGLIQVSSIPTGDSMDTENTMPNQFIMTGFTSDNQLNFNIMYNSGKYTKELIDSFIKNYQSIIEEIAVFVETQKESIQTLSDIEAAEISASSLEKINSIAELLF